MNATTEKIISVASRFEVVAGSCAGPHGKLKVFVLGNDPSSATPDISLTTHSKTLISFGSHIIHPSSPQSNQDPFALVIIELAKRHSEQHGDGGLLALQLSSSLICGALRSRIHHHFTSMAFSKAMVIVLFVVA
jgi:hypothetical protein